MLCCNDCMHSREHSRAQQSRASSLLITRMRVSVCARVCVSVYVVCVVYAIVCVWCDENFTRSPWGLGAYVRYAVSSSAYRLVSMMRYIQILSTHHRKDHLLF